MKITTVGHAGLHIETRQGRILCDPWVNPAFFASWFPFPDNSRLDWRRYGDVEYLYISHLHRDHFDPKNLTDNVSLDATILLPDYPTDDLHQELFDLGFRKFLLLPNSRRVTIHGLSLMIVALTAPNDGPVGDSALVIDDGTACILNQNDAKLTDFGPLQNFAPFDAHFLQFSGANWWPWVYTLPEKAKHSFGARKRANGLARALRFVETVNARHVVPFAGPACFLDEELIGYNDFDNDETNTFPDHTVFLDYLAERGRRNGLLMVPGTVLDLTRGGQSIRHPAPHDDVMEPFTDKVAYLRRYADSKQHVIAAERDAWGRAEADILPALKDWFEPLMEQGDRICTGIGASLLLEIDDGDKLIIDFLDHEVRTYRGEKCRYTFRLAGDLLRTLIAQGEMDWTNSLFLSMRFDASRIGSFNEYLYTFFTCLSAERMQYAESYYADQHSDEADVQIGDWMVERRCPHRNADLSRFGQLDGDTLTCEMHGWKFDLPTGRCLTSANHKIRSYHDSALAGRE
jgi:UDP-MurNAc hydroxylase